MSCGSRGTTACLRKPRSKRRSRIWRGCRTGSMYCVRNATESSRRPANICCLLQPALHLATVTIIVSRHNGSAATLALGACTCTAASVNVMSTLRSSRAEASRRRRSHSRGQYLIRLRPPFFAGQRHMILKYRAKDANSTQWAENEVGRMHNARLAKQRHRSSWLSATHKLLELSKSLSCFGALVHVSYASLFWRALRVCNAEGSKFFANLGSR